MKALLAALFVLLFVAPVQAKEVTKKTEIALVWRNLPKTGFETENATAPFPGGHISFTRDVEGISTDEFIILYDTSGFCQTMVASSSSVSLKCGLPNRFFMLVRLPGAQGIQLFLFVTETVPDDPPPAKANPTKKVPPLQQPWIKRT